MTPDAFIIITIIISVTVILVISTMFGPRHRDSAEQDRDRGLAKLFEARAEILHTESLERQQVMYIETARRRDAACADARKS